MTTFFSLNKYIVFDMSKNLIKYLLLTIIIISILEFAPNFNIDNHYLIPCILAIIVIAYIVEKMLFRKYETMDQINNYRPIIDFPTGNTNEQESCDRLITIPNKYNLSTQEQDLVLSGLDFNNDSTKFPILQQGEFDEILATSQDINSVIDNQRYTPKTIENIPGYYLINNGTFSNGIPFEKIKYLIGKSKFKNLYNQHNHFIKWSPHTHIGKERGYLNWDKNL